MRLENQIAVVTGGGQGIGAQIALRLARDGAAVVIADVNVDGARQTAAGIAERGGREARVIPTDISVETEVRALVEGALGIAGRIDILVNNSGIMGPVQNIEEIALADWRATMAVNLDGMFLCCKHVVPGMKRQGRGCIVNIAS
ncbi:MAG: SDR family NAD(P)-dependent oxidoreductase, partial [Candidatus Methylomirabilota bacterium]